MPLWLPRKRWPLLLLLLPLLTFISFGLRWFVYQGPFSDTSLLAHHIKHGPGKYWPSFAGISTLIVFGDSWSALGNKACVSYTPDEAYHFGNPDFPGVTTANGPNWVGYLTHAFNQSVIGTYDLAVGGSTIDTKIIPGMFTFDLKVQLRWLLGPLYRCQYLPETFDPASTLVAVFFGINDIASCAHDQDCDIYHPPIAQVFASYTQSLTTLYDAGARNFLLLNAPPGDASIALDLPSNDDRTKAQTRASIQFNTRHRQLAQHLRTTFEDITVFEFDVWDLFQKIYHHPQGVPDTAIYKNLTHPCPSYGIDKWPNGEEVSQAEIDSCGGLRPEEYLWNSVLHVTWPVHKAMARGIVDVLTAHEKPSYR